MGNQFPQLPCAPKGRYGTWVTTTGTPCPWRVSAIARAADGGPQGGTHGRRATALATPDERAAMRGISLRDLISPSEEEAPMRDAGATGGELHEPASVAKSSIGFILGVQSDVDDEVDVAMKEDEEEDTLSDREHRPSEEVAPLDSASDQTPAKKKKRKARICKEPGCQKYVVDHGLCIRHGGGKRCSVEGCNCRAQNRGLCWKHGGYTICKIEGCTKRAKSRGICWSHGGGTRCKTDGCIKIAVSHGKCWAHGGGKRCIVDGCKRPASERTDNCCADHFGYAQHPQPAR